MNAKEISDETLESITPANDDLLLIYDTSAGITGKSTLADIAPKVAENFDIADLSPVTPAVDDALMIRDTSAGTTGKATITEIINTVLSITDGTLNFNSDIVKGGINEVFAKKTGNICQIHGNFMNCELSSGNLLSIGTTNLKPLVPWQLITIDPIGIDIRGFISQNGEIQVLSPISGTYTLRIDATYLCS